jgi:acetone carboxylase beta subunit
MAPARSHSIRAIGMDAGGTMTDTILVGDDGRFVIGKARTTPVDESIGFRASAHDASGYWGLELEQIFPAIVTGVYSGTSMLNRLLERTGRRLGLLVSLGMEDALLMERGIQTSLGYSYADTLHVVTHRHHKPLVDRSLIRGIGGRITADGREAIPLYEDDVSGAIEELLEEHVECICVNFLFSWRNPSHELRTAEIAKAIMSRLGRSVPVRLSADVSPTRRELPRLNTLVIDSYAAEPSRRQLHSIRATTRRLGAQFELRAMAGFGGTISMDSSQLIATLVSGPIGGCVGAQHLSETIEAKNIVCTDIGGTSFDVALVIDGKHQIKTDPAIAHFMLNVPMVSIDSIGAGTGSFVRINPLSRRLEFGPDSAGSRIGVCNVADDVETVTITDCNVVLGRLNPEYFLGGELPISRSAARRAVEEQIAKPLGLRVEDAAAGVIDLFEAELTREVEALVMGQGFEPADFTLLSYGGGGPLHVAAYASPLHFEDVLVPSWAAGFSAFGCLCADYAYRFDKQVDLPLPSLRDSREIEDFASLLNGAWNELRAKIAHEFHKSGIAVEQVSFAPYLRLQYQGQLNDIEVPSPVPRLDGVADLAAVIAQFERSYGNIYGGAARSPELGYHATLAIMTGKVPHHKPRLPDDPVTDDPDPSEAVKTTRAVYDHGAWRIASIYDMERLRPGHHLIGPAVVEAPSTTLYLPDLQRARLDRHRLFHLSS